MTLLTARGIARAHVTASIHGRSVAKAEVLRGPGPMAFA